MNMKKKAIIAISALALFALAGCFGKNGAAAKKEANENAPKEFAQDDGIDEWLIETEDNSTAPVESGANESTAKSKDLFALIRRARRHSTYDIEKLLADGANVNAKDRYGETALMLTARK
ncbi:MAG: hypothetical protein K2H67_03755 [Treponemataceae bacterium]|nr:hypothetical protein [Treponemataceae bacterium]